MPPLKLTPKQAALLGARIRATRKASGYQNARDFQRKLGFVERSLYYQWELGRRTPSDEAIKKMSKACNVSYNWLKTGEGSPYKGSKIANSEARKKEALISYELLSQDVSSSNKHIPSKVRNAIISHVEQIGKTKQVRETVYIHIDEKLMNAIFAELLNKFETKKRKVDIRKLTKLASQAYADIVSTEKDSRVQHRIIKTVVTAYERFIS